MVAIVEAPFTLTTKLITLPETATVVESTSVIPQFARSAYLYAYKYLLACEERFPDPDSVTPYSFLSPRVLEAREWLHRGFNMTATEHFSGPIILPWKRNQVEVMPLGTHGPYTFMALPDITTVHGEPVAHMNMSFRGGVGRSFPDELSLLYHDVDTVRLMRFRGLSVPNGRSLQYAALGPDTMQAFSLSLREEHNRQHGIALAEQSEFTQGIIRASGFAGMLAYA